MNDQDKAVKVMCQAFKELNTIRARDGGPYTSDGWGTCVSAEYFSKVVDDLDEAVKLLTGKSAHCHPSLYKQWNIFSKKSLDKVPV